MTDERHGVPSASVAGRVDACSFSHKLSQKAPPQPEREDAASGTRIHTALEQGPESDAWLQALSPAEQQTAGMCWHQMLTVLGQWDGIEDDNQDSEEALWASGHKELRIGLTALWKAVDVTPDSTAKFIFTGKADLIAVKNGRAICIDYKTGRGETEESASNPQLRALAVLASKRFGVRDITVCVVAPWQGKPQMAEFNDAALTAAEAWLKDLIRREKAATEADLNPGPWCVFCPAQTALLCPKHTQTALAAPTALELETLPAGKESEAMFARGMEMPAAEFIDLVSKLPRLEELVSAIKGALRRRYENGDPEILAAFTREKDQNIRTIENVAAAYEAVRPLGVTLEALWSVASIPVGDLDELVHRASGPRILKDGRPGKGFAISLEEAKKRTAAALEEHGALKWETRAGAIKRAKSIEA